jgi:hypothetical protein
MRDAEAVLTSQWNGRTAVVDLELGDGGAQTWEKTSGSLDLGSTAGVWNAVYGGQYVALFDGPDAIATKAVVILDNVPSHFMDRFCVEFTGDGSIVLGLAEIDRINWTLDINPCA